MTNNTIKSWARLRLLLVATAFLALPLGSCTDAGDSPAGPGTGGPNGDDGTAGISAKVKSARPGGSTTILGTFRDANATPVEGAQIIAGYEGRTGYFSFVTNPTLTSASGGFSIGVNVSSSTPAGSYTLVVATSSSYSGPYAVDYLTLQVIGANVPTELTLTTSTSSIEVGESAIFTVVASASADNCTPVFQYQAAGALTADWTIIAGSGNSRLFTLTPTTDGTLTVLARAYCPGSTEVMYSDKLDVTVGAATLPTMSSVTLSGASTYSLLSGGGVVFSLSGTGSSGCTVRLRFQASGAGAVAVDVNPATAGAQAAVTPTVQPGTLTAVGSGWCTENPTAVQTSTVNVTVGP